MTRTSKIRGGLHAGVGGLSGFLTGVAGIVQAFRVEGRGILEFWGLWSFEEGVYHIGLGSVETRLLACHPDNARQSCKITA